MDSDSQGRMDLKGREASLLRVTFRFRSRHMAGPISMASFASQLLVVLRQNRTLPTSGRITPRGPPRADAMAQRRLRLRTPATSPNSPMRRGCHDPRQEPCPDISVLPPPVRPRTGFGASACKMGSPESSVSFPSRRFLHQARSLLTPLECCRSYGLEPATRFGTAWAAGQRMTQSTCSRR